MPSYTMIVNGVSRTVDVPADMPLLWVLRETLGITGPKYGCGVGVCGACTSHIDGAARRPCVTYAQSATDGGPGYAGRRVTTIEGLAPSADTLHRVQQAWIDEDVAQCGYCQGGQIMTAAAFLASRAPGPLTDAEIDAAMSENVCRCGTYPRIRRAVRRAATQT